MSGTLTGLLILSAAFQSRATAAHASHMLTSLPASCASIDATAPAAALPWLPAIPVLRLFSADSAPASLREASSHPLSFGGGSNSGSSGDGDDDKDDKRDKESMGKQDAGVGSRNSNVLSSRAEWWLAARDIVAGTAGGVAGIAVGQPLDLIKTRIQSGEFNSVRQCIVSTARNEGMRAFFKGLSSPVLGNLPINMIVFGARGHMDRLLDTHFPRAAADVASGRPSYLRVTAASLWAGLLQLVVVVPVELVKCKLQVQQDSVKITIGAKARAAVAAQAAAHPPPIAALGAPLYSGPWDCVKQLYRARGIPGLFSGGWVTAWRDVPAYAAWFLAYDFTRVQLTSSEDLASGKPTSMRTALLAGSVAGIATWVSTFPFDVIKSVIQTAPPGTPPEQLKIAYVARENYNRHGFKWFWKGINPTLLRAVPVSAATFVVYEWVLDAFGR